MNSPEYFKEQERKEKERLNQKLNKSQGNSEEEEKAKREADAQKKREQELMFKEQAEANQQKFIDTTIEKYSLKKEQEDQHSVLTKDQAYIAAGKILEHNKKMRGLEKNKFLEKNFLKVWEDHDETKKNYLSLDEAGLFVKDLLDEDKE